MFNLMQVSGRELTEGGIERDGIALGGEGGWDDKGLLKVNVV